MSRTEIHIESVKSPSVVINIGGIACSSDAVHLRGITSLNDVTGHLLSLITSQTDFVDHECGKSRTAVYLESLTSLTCVVHLVDFR